MIGPRCNCARKWAAKLLDGPLPQVGWFVSFPLFFFVNTRHPVCRTCRGTTTRRGRLDNERGRVLLRPPLGKVLLFFPHRQKAEPESRDKKAATYPRPKQFPDRSITRPAQIHSFRDPNSCFCCCSHHHRRRIASYGRIYTPATPSRYRTTC
jgi:hypothetical protein